MSVFESFMTGNRAGQQDADRNTRRRAGSLMAGGDYAGASSALYEGGDLQGGQAVGTMDRQNQMAPLVRDGKFDEAQAIPGATLEEMGQIREFRDGADKATRERTAQTFELFGSVAAGLLNVPQEGRMAEALRLAPILGIDSSVITPDMLTDAGLQTLIARSMGTAEYLKLQRPQATPFGIIYPPGSNPGPTAQQPAQGAAPQVGQRATNPNDPNAPALVWNGTEWAPEGSARPKPAPVRAGAERNQTPTVSFRSSQEARATIQRLVPGVGFNSGYRDEATNRRVGGVENSWHRKDRAWDLDPPRGMTNAQLAARMKQAGFRVLDEGDHVHVSW